MVKCSRDAAPHLLSPNVCLLSVREPTSLPHAHYPPRLIAGARHPEPSESLTQRIARRRLLVGLHNQYLNQLADWAFWKVQLEIGRRGRGVQFAWSPCAGIERKRGVGIGHQRWENGLTSGPAAPDLVESQRERNFKDIIS
jgi:hypothetical protein